LLQTAAQIDGNYCEAWDGSGFPHGKAGRAIPLPARLVTAACAYATLLEEARKPGQRYAVNRIADALINQRGRKLDPDLVDLLIAYEPKFAALFDDTLHTMAA
jgi:putative two-component system response regulator